MVTLIVFDEREAKALLSFLKENDLEGLTGLPAFRAVLEAKRIGLKKLSRRFRKLAVAYLKFRLARFTSGGNPEELVKADKELVRVEKQSGLTTVVNLPALYQSWASHFETTRGSREQVLEEIEEVLAALRRGDTSTSNEEEQQSCLETAAHA